MEELFLYYPELFPLLVVAVCFAFLLIRQYIHNHAPEYVGTATVVSRRPEAARFHGKYSSGWNYLVTFRLGSETVELYVSEAEYASLAEGITGTLRWQHENLLSFEVIP